MNSVMPRYNNLSGNSRIAAYEIGEDFIKIQFHDDGIYLYNSHSAGWPSIETMKRLAEDGKGLNTFVDTYVKKRYAQKVK